MATTDWPYSQPMWTAARWLTPEEVAEQEAAAKREQEEFEAHWPRHNWRPRCPFCGCWAKKQTHAWFFDCKRCGGGRLD